VSPTHGLFAAGTEDGTVECFDPRTRGAVGALQVCGAGGGSLGGASGGGVTALRFDPGMVVQVDPIKPMLKAPECEHLKLKCDDMLSNLAFNFNLRRFTPAACTWPRGTPMASFAYSTCGRRAPCTPRTTCTVAPSWYGLATHRSQRHCMPRNSRHGGSNMYCWPRHRTPGDSRQEGSKCVG
jgi:hypothetical protein